MRKNITESCVAYLPQDGRSNNLADEGLMVQLFVVIQVIAFTKLNQLTYFGRRLRPDDVIVEVRYEGHQNPLNVSKLCFQAIQSLQYATSK